MSCDRSGDERTAAVIQYNNAILISNKNTTSQHVALRLDTGRGSNLLSIYCKFEWTSDG